MGSLVSAFEDEVAQGATDPGETSGAGGPPGVVRYRLTAEGAAAAFSLAESCARRYDSAHDPAFLAAAQVLAHGLPPAVRRAANTARLDDRKHAFVLSGNTVEPWLEATPVYWREADTAASSTYAFLLVLYASLLGDPIGWATQQDGRIVTDVLPVRGLENSLVSSSSERELGWHTEDAFSDCRADYVGLFCLRTRGDIPTTLSYADPAALPRDVVRVLGEKRFHVLPDASHSTSPVGEDAQTLQLPAGGPGSLERVALLTGPADAPSLRVDRDFTVAVDGDRESEEALRELIAHLDRNTYEVVLDAGDVGFIDNRNVVHGRRPFRAEYDGKDRWLKRVNVVSDLRRTRAQRPTALSRVVG